MNYCRTELLLVVLIVSVAGRKAKLTVVPKNVAVVQGEDVIMNCTKDGSSGTLIWKILNETQTNASLSTLHTGNKFANNFRDCCTIVNATKGEFTLKFKTRKDIPLHYVCEEVSLERAGADLVVLESKPRCAVEEDGRDIYSCVQIWCTVKYVGNWTPVMEWKMISKEGTELPVNNGSINAVCANNVVTSTINISAHSIMNGFKLACTTRFVEFRRHPECAQISVIRINWPVARNEPEYSYTWTSKTLYVITESNASWIRFHRMDSSMSRSVIATLIPVIVAICVVGGFCLGFHFSTTRYRTNWISKAMRSTDAAVRSEQNGDLVEIEDHTCSMRSTHISSHQVTGQVATIAEADPIPPMSECTTQIQHPVDTLKDRSEDHIMRSTQAGISPQPETGQAATIAEIDHLPAKSDAVEQQGYGPEKQKSSRAAAVKLRPNTGYVEMRGKTKTKPNQHQGKTKSEYVTMNPVGLHKSIGPTKPPRASQLDPPSNSTKVDRPRMVCSPPKKPPRVSQSDTTQYVEMNIARAYAAGVAPPSPNPMFSQVEVYATIDHNAASVLPPPSKQT